ncbi:hypothetical protein K8I28_10640 [bacterium]|nr:hypothetical protein [bacterium]
MAGKLGKYVGLVFPILIPVLVLVFVPAIAHSSDGNAQTDVYLEIQPYNTIAIQGDIFVTVYSAQFANGNDHVSGSAFAEVNTNTDVRLYLPNTITVTRLYENPDVPNWEQLMQQGLWNEGDFDPIQDGIALDLTVHAEIINFIPYIDAQNDPVDHNLQYLEFPWENPIPGLPDGEYATVLLTAEIEEDWNTLDHVAGVYVGELNLWFENIP